MLNSCTQENLSETKTDVVPNLIQNQKLKIVASVVKFIETFKISEMLSEHLYHCLVDNNTYFDSHFSLVIDDYSEHLGINGNSTLTLNSVGNVFNFKLNCNQEFKKAATLTINLDENQNIQTGEFNFHLHLRNNRFDATDIKLIFDDSFNLIESRYNSILVSPQTKSLIRNDIIKDEKSIISVSDELFFINMRLNKDNEMLIDLLPEAFIPSAYDFNHVDFQSRFEMIDMVLY